MSIIDKTYRCSTSTLYRQAQSSKAHAKASYCLAQFASCWQKQSYSVFYSFQIVFLSGKGISIGQCMAMRLDNKETAPCSILISIRICPAHHFRDERTLWLQDAFVAAWPTHWVSHLLAYACMHGIAGSASERTDQNAGLS